MSKRVAEEPAKEEPAKEEPADEEEKELAEEEMLKEQLKAHPEPGRLIAIAGPTMVMVMWNMSLATQSNPTEAGISFAANILDCGSALQGKSLKQQVEMVLARARGADKWNRGIEMSSVLDAAFSAFNGIFKVVCSDHNLAYGKKFPRRTAVGTWIPHSSTVSGFMAKGLAIRGGTGGFLMEAWRLQEHIPELHNLKPTLYIGTSCWKVTVIDARSWTPPAPGAKEAGEEPVCKKQRKELPVFPMTEEKCNFPIRPPSSDDK
jgi:hypothetical protein